MSLLFPPGLFAGPSVGIVASSLVAPGRPWWRDQASQVFLHPRDFFLLVVEMADVDERTRINARERLRYLERRWTYRGGPRSYPRSIAEAWSKGERR